MPLSWDEQPAALQQQGGAGEQPGGPSSSGLVWKHPQHVCSWSESPNALLTEPPRRSYRSAKPWDPLGVCTTPAGPSNTGDNSTAQTLWLCFGASVTNGTCPGKAEALPFPCGLSRDAFLAFACPRLGTGQRGFPPQHPARGHTLVVFTLLPLLQLQPERSGSTLHSSPSRHGSIWHHHFCSTMEAGGDEGVSGRAAALGTEDLARQQLGEAALVWQCMGDRVPALPAFGRCSPSLRHSPRPCRGTTRRLPGLI